VRAINTVVLAGIPYRRAELDSMLELVEEQAGSWTMWPNCLAGLDQPHHAKAVCGLERAQGLAKKLL
jgi:hypothetical protein